MTPILLLFGLGLALIVAEVLVPSLGVLGTLAALCIVGSVVWAFALSTGAGLQMLLAAAVLVPGALLAGFKLLPHSPLARKLFAPGFSFADGSAADPRDASLPGRVGRVEAPLRPVGTARFEGRRVDVVSRGELIEAGASVRVLEVRGNRVLVARVEPPRTDPNGPSESQESA